MCWPLCPKSLSPFYQSLKPTPLLEVHKQRPLYLKNAGYAPGWLECFSVNVLQTSQSLWWCICPHLLFRSITVKQDGGYVLFISSSPEHRSASIGPGQADSGFSPSEMTLQVDEGQILWLPGCLGVSCGSLSSSLLYIETKALLYPLGYTYYPIRHKVKTTYHFQAPGNGVGGTRVVFPTAQCTCG